jgi:hypothetical protein
MSLGHSPRISTDGLVLALDAANPKNYNLTAVEVLVVAGGGGSTNAEGNPAGDGAGGGGGGGVLTETTSISSQQYTIVVGDGGLATNGQNSSAFGLTAIGGGCGGGMRNAGVTSGGSGGGAGGNCNQTNRTGGSGTEGQGNRGGNDLASGCSNRGGVGGGGAGKPGVDANSSNGSNGGDGIISYISGQPAYYGGGGGGGPGGGATGFGLGGLGGGGNGSNRSVVAQNGAPNTGGGGGGGSSGTGYISGGKGGSGIVIVRYPGPQKAIGGTVTSVGGYTIHTFTSVGSTTFTPLAATNNSAILGLSDFSGNNRFATTANGTTYNSSNGGCISFDGTNDYVSISNPITSSQPYSVIQWIKPNVALTDTTNSASRKTPLVGPGPVWNPGYWLTARVFRVHAHTEYRDVTINWVGDTGWHQVGQIFDGTTCYTVIDGNILLGTRTAYSPPVPSTILIGAETTAGSSVNWNGNISATTFYNRALTSQEVLQNYNALKGRYEKGGINNPFSSPTEARTLGYTSGDYYFQSGSMSSPQLLEFQRDYYEDRAWVCVFRSPYRSTATTNKINLNIPMGGLLVQRDALDLRAAVYWSNPITYNTVGGSGNNTADSGYSPRRVILGNSGGHGIYATNQTQCNWSTATGAIGAGWDGGTCGSFPNDLVWGTGRSDTATYENRSGIWSHWITWG